MRGCNVTTRNVTILEVWVVSYGWSIGSRCRWCDVCFFVLCNLKSVQQDPGARPLRTDKPKLPAQCSSVCFFVLCNLKSVQQDPGHAVPGHWELINPNSLHSVQVCVCFFVLCNLKSVQQDPVPGHWELISSTQTPGRVFKCVCVSLFYVILNWFNRTLPGHWELINPNSRQSVQVEGIWGRFRIPLLVWEFLKSLNFGRLETLEFRQETLEFRSDISNLGTFLEHFLQSWNFGPFCVSSSSQQRIWYKFESYLYQKTTPDAGDGWARISFPKFQGT